MGILVNLDVMMARRKISSGELAEKIGIVVLQGSLSNLEGHGVAFKFGRFSHRLADEAARLAVAVATHVRVDIYEFLLVAYLAFAEDPIGPPFNFGQRRG